MRTTLSLDDDVAARLEQLRRDLGIPLKNLVNDALRRGFAAMQEPQGRARRHRTTPVDLGRCRLPNVDDVTAALEAGEGDGHR